MLGNAQQCFSKPKAKFLCPSLRARKNIYLLSLPVTPLAATAEVWKWGFQSSDDLYGKRIVPHKGFQFSFMYRRILGLYHCIKTVRKQ